LDATNCATPNATPQTTAGSHAFRIPRRPSTIATRISGTTRASNGVCRPTIAPSVSVFRRGSSAAPEVTVASVTIGVARAPNATGAVFATSATTAALSGWKPRAISMTTVMATGVPNPASASSRAPKQKAMMIAWTRWSALTFSNERRSTSKWPLATVRL
jgi:hypothetical protein